MKHWRINALALGALATLAVNGTVFAQSDMHGAPGAYQAVLTAQNEVPPTSSTGLGLASFLLSADGNTLFYSLELSGASSAIGAAHIHLGAPGQNGEVVANLCGAGGTPACATEGVIASGSITASSLVGSLAGKPLSDLVAALGSRSAYANAHTATNPGGELRGQVQSATEMMNPGDMMGRGEMGQHDMGTRGNADQEDQQDHSGD